MAHNSPKNQHKLEEQKHDEHVKKDDEKRENAETRRCLMSCVTKASRLLIDFPVKNIPIQTPTMHCQSLFNTRAFIVAAFVAVSALPAHAQTASPTPAKKELELKQKELDLQKKEIDLQKQQMQIDAAKKELQAKETEKNVTINLQGDVAFDSGKAALKPEGEKSLEKVAVVLSQYRDSKVSIIGYTDNQGGAKSNLLLSEKRAEAVKDWFVKHGVATAAITTKGMGEENPAATNQNADGTDNPDGRRQNRRVEITVQK